MNPNLKQAFQPPTINWGVLRYCNLAVIATLALGIGLRLFDLTDQPIDFHPTRQLRGAIIARGMYYEMLPSADETTQRQAMAFWASTGQYEPSILERLMSITYLVLGKEVFWLARIYNTLFWVIGGAVLFVLARRMAMASLPEQDQPGNKTIACGSALIGLAYYLVLPFSVQASRSFQPDPGMVTWMVLSVYALYRWSERQEWKWAILTGIFSGMAVLTKAVALYIVFASMLAILVSTSRILQIRQLSIKNFFTPFARILLNPQVWCMALLMIAPTMIYYLGKGQRASEYFSSWTIALSHLLIASNTYLRWMNLVQGLMNWIALLLALAGILIAKQRNRALLVGLWLGYLIYGLFLPYQMYTHSYYHLQLVPIVALSITPIVQVVLVHLFRMKKIWQILFATAMVALLIYTSWQALIPLYSQDYKNEPAYWQEIASYLPSDGKIISLTQDYGYRLMYYGWRKVTLWPNRGEFNLSNLRGSNKEFQEFFSKRIEGKSYFLVTAFRQFDDQPALQQILYDHYPLLAEGPGYLIFDLTKPQNDN